MSSHFFICTPAKWEWNLKDLLPSRCIRESLNPYLPKQVLASLSHQRFTITLPKNVTFLLCYLLSVQCIAEKSDSNLNSQSFIDALFYSFWEPLGIFSVSLLHWNFIKIYLRISLFLGLIFFFQLGLFTEPFQSKIPISLESCWEIYFYYVFFSFLYSFLPYRFFVFSCGNSH